MTLGKPTVFKSAGMSAKDSQPTPGAPCTITYGTFVKRRATTDCSLDQGTFKKAKWQYGSMSPDLRNNLKSSGPSLYDCSMTYITLKASIASHILTTTGALIYTQSKHPNPFWKAHTFGDLGSIEHCSISIVKFFLSSIWMLCSPLCSCSLAACGIVGLQLRRSINNIQQMT